MIQVEEDEGEGSVEFVGAGELLFEELIEAGAVGETGERIGEGLGLKGLVFDLDGTDLLLGLEGKLDECLLRFLEDLRVAAVDADVHFEELGDIAGGGVDVAHEAFNVLLGHVEAFAHFGAGANDEGGGIARGEDVSDDDGNVDDFDDGLEFLVVVGGFVVCGDGAGEDMGEFPELCEHGADVAVGEVEARPAAGHELFVVAVGEFPEVIEFVAEDAVHDEDADVGEEAGEEDFLLLHDGKVFGEDACGGAGVDGGFPVAHVIEAAGGVFALKIGDEGEAEGEGLDGLQSEDDEGVGNRGDALGKAIEGGVDGLEDLGGEGGVVGDELCDFGDVDVFAAREFEGANGDGGK